MTKAEEAALKVYPVDMQPLVYQDLIEQFGGKTEVDVNIYQRRFFQEGYEQAEKDLVLTAEDIRTIYELTEKVSNHSIWAKYSSGFWDKVLKLFKEVKKWLQLPFVFLQ